MIASGKQQCPFCGGLYELGDDGEPYAEHSQPWCSDFETLDPLEFAVAARVARGIPLDGES